MMHPGLSGKTALVLGAGGGVGGEIAHALAREGSNVVVADIDEKAAQATLDDVASFAGRNISFKWDHADLDSVETHVSRIEKELGTVDLLINNTGGPPPAPLIDQDLSIWPKSPRAVPSP